MPTLPQMQPCAAVSTENGLTFTLGEGPHYYEWMREFGDSEQDRRIMLILNTDNHPDDDTLWRLMEQRWGA